MSAVHRWTLVALSVLAMALSFLERQTLSVLAPTVCSELHLSNAQYGWTGTAFSLALLCATFGAGIFLDKAGVRRGLIWAAAAWSLAAAAHGLAAGFGSLLAVRALLGVSEAPAFPGSAQVIRRVLAPERVARGVGFVLSGATLGVLGAYFISVALEQRFGWRGAYFGVAALSALWIPLWALASRRLELPTALASRPPDARDLLQPAVLRAVIFTLLISPAFAFATLFWPKFLAGRFGVPQSGIAFYGFLLPIAYDLGAIALGDLAGRTRAGAVLLLGSGLGTLVALVPHATGPWMAVALAAPAFFGLGGAFSTSTAGALVAVDHASVSRAGALIATANSLGIALAGPLIGWSVDRTGSWTPALSALPLLIVPGAAAWLYLMSPKRLAST